MTVAAINYLNILLMLVSVVLAYFFPFELFLFSYAIMGPLHYTTEIGWLHKRKYFTNSANDYYFLGAIALTVIILMLAEVVYKHFAASDANVVLVTSHLRVWIANMILMAFIAAFAAILFKNTFNKLIFTFITTGALLLVHTMQPYLLVLAVILPTMLHVTIFMVAFILFGAIKGKSMSGYLSVAVFVACCSAFFIYNPTLPHQVSSFTLELFYDGGFIAVNRIFVGSHSLQETLFSPTGIMVQRLIAFSYTYHYLNWFSKTKIIDWYNVTPAWRWFCFISWVGFVALYFIDFKTGIVAIFFVSMLHVFLEFPLNFRTFIFIGQTALANFKKQ